MTMHSAASAANSTSRPSSLHHQHHGYCPSSHQLFHQQLRNASAIKPRAAAADAAVTTIRLADIQPVQCLKEWAPVCAALGDGLQTVLLRKGGIREPTFTPKAQQFLLFPTAFHSEAQLLKPGIAERYQQEMQLEPRQLQHIPLAYFAAITGAWTTKDERVLQQLDPLHVHSEGFLETRLKWRSKDPLTLLELRAWVLQQPLQLPAREQYFGCFSFVELLAEDMGLAGSTAAAADAGGVAAAGSITTVTVGSSIRSMQCAFGRAPVATVQPCRRSSTCCGLGASSLQPRTKVLQQAAKQSSSSSRPAACSSSVRSRQTAVTCRAADDRQQPGAAKAGSSISTRFNPVYLAIFGAFSALLVFKNPYIYAVLTILTILPQNSNVTSLNNLVLLFYESGLFMNFAEAVTCVRLVTWLSMGFMVASFALFK
ncbi:hypothetical protein OEZ86_012529 [Tetradesmus obliquus]|nr:hypothetical protein OEZ86_012529 [Tetradesmus obliquus]